MPKTEQCSICGRELIRDEIGMTRKLISRAATEFLCYDCLSQRFGTDVTKLKEMAERYRSEGCMLFN